VPIKMATKVDDDVIENINATTGNDNHAIELEDVQPEPKPPAVNGIHNNYNNNNNSNNKSDTKKGGASALHQYPKIFIGLLVILIIAVIALSIVLHGIDKRVDEENDVSKVNTNTNDISKLTKRLATLTAENAKLREEVDNVTKKEDNDKKNIGVLANGQKNLKEAQEQTKTNVKTLQDKVSEQKKVTDGLDKRLGTAEGGLNSAKTNLTKLADETSANKESIKDMKASVDVDKGDIKKLLNLTQDLGADVATDQENIANHTKTLGVMKESLDTQKTGISDLGEKLHNTTIELSAGVSDIETLKSNSSTLEVAVNTNAGGVANLKDQFHQLHLNLQYTKEISDQIGLPFKSVLALLGLEDKVTKQEEVIKKLLSQAQEFKQHKADWGITIQDVAKLIDGEDLRGKGNLVTIKKLVKLDTEFKKNYKTKWGIEFKDVFKLTTKEDMKSIPLNVDTNSITVLDKIEGLFQAFKKYNEIWNVPFKDIVDLTPDLNFTDASKSPALVTVSGWYVKGFSDVWGKEAFHSFFHIMMENEAKRSDLVASISKITTNETKKRFLKFLPGKFLYQNGKLSVQGYIQIWYHNLTGTLRDKDQTMFNQFSDASAKTICLEAGYSKTDDGWGNGKYRDSTTAYDRSNLRCLLSGLQCRGQKPTIKEDCIMDQFKKTQLSSNETSVTTAVPPVPPVKQTTTPKPQPEPTTASKPTKVAQPTTTPQPSNTTQPPATTKGPQTTSKGAQTTTQPPQTTTQPPQTTQPPTTQQITTTPDPWKWKWDHKEDVAIKCNL